MYNTEESKTRWLEEHGNDKGLGFTLFHTLDKRKKVKLLSTDKRNIVFFIQDRIENRYFMIK